MHAKRIVNVTFHWGHFWTDEQQLDAFDISLVQTVKDQLGLGPDEHMSDDWMAAHPREILTAYHAWISHHEQLGEKRFSLIPVMDIKSHHITVRSACKQACF